jgi:two-component system, NtrC family, nitrogen regulation response regulator GlnG
LIRRAVDESLREEVAEERMVAAPEMLGQAPAMQDVFRAIGKLSQSNVTVMITGESGTGKELVARALHKHSPRGDVTKSAAKTGSNLLPTLTREGPFVAINTAAIPKDLLESELFGHERGAFTGAQTMRRGRFEQADGGTLFLDEIGDMPFDLQTRLLRVLSDGHFYRVGGHTAIKTNVRVIAATHQDLEQRVKEGGFREDLFHRLNVIRLRLPALHQRREDIPMLSKHFLIQSAKQLGVEPKRFTEAALAQLAGFSFPGNVRQLENICHWLTVMAPSQVIEPKDLPPEVQGSSANTYHVEHVDHPSVVPTVSHPAVAKEHWGDVVSAAMPFAQTSDLPIATNGLSNGSANDANWEQGMAKVAQALLATDRTDVWDEMTRRFESHLIQAALVSTKGRRVDAAHKLGIGRNTITRKIQELGLGKE